MAGKIVPAISSSNALVAALQVMEAIKLLAGEAKKQQLKAITYQRQGGNTRLASFSRINEPPKEDCVVCSDDSASIATVKLRCLADTKLSALVNQILPDCLNVKSEGELLIDFEGKIIFERFEDMSDDESTIYTNRLNKALSQLSLKPSSILML